METRTAARRVALGTIAVGAVVFVVLAVVRVPWSGLPQAVPASSVFAAADIERAEHYARWGRVWSWSGLAVSLAVACWLGFGRRGRRWAARVPGWWWVRIVAVVAALTLVGRVVTLPFGIALRRLALEEGVAAGTWGAWAVDVVKSELITIGSTSLAVVVLLGCARRWPRAWPAIAGVLGAGLVAAGSFVYPVLVEPVFNQFESLPDGALRTDVLALADAEGVRVDDVLVADASRRTTALNAYVSGFGHTRRVVLYDTLVDDTPRDEVLSVVAHELAHAKYDDVGTGTALGAAGALVGIGLLGLLVPLGERRERGGRPERGADPVTLVPAVLALAALATVLSAPLQNGISRQLEARADRTALEQTKDPAAFVALQRRLALRAHADPTPPAWSQFWFGSHPTVLQRVALARRGG